jgi:hypothetical protein
MKKLAIGIAALVCSLSCLAQDKDLVVGLHIGTYHDVDNYENFNPGAYVRYRNWTAGWFYNSLSSESQYVAYSWDYRSSWLPDVVDSLTLTAGLVSGYRYSIQKSGISVLVAPSVAFKVAEDVRLRVVVTPALDRNVQSTSFHFTLEKSF